MKKNLRIASAAAAALLAVAPVAASAVNPANADVTVNNQTPSSNPSKPKADGDITINFSLNANADTSVEAAQKSVKVSAQGSSASLGDIKNTTDPKTNQVTIVYGTNNSGAGETAGTPVAGPLKAGVNYAIKVTGLTLSNLTTGKNYSIAGGTFTKGADENGNYSASTLKHGDDFTSDNFQVYDTKKTGSVSFVNSNNSLVKSGSIKLSSLTPASGKYNVSDVVKAIVGDSTTKPYQPVVDNGNATASWNDTKAEVKKALTNDGVDVAGDGTFTAPAGNVVIPVTATASNGNKATLRVTLVVDSNTEAQTSGLKFKLNPTSTLSDKASITAPAENSNDPYTLDLKQNATDTASSIASQFTATYEGKNGEAKLDYSTPVTVKSTNLNTAVVGKYQVVLTATNPTNNKSKDITVEVTVGDPGKTATVEAGSDVANVVNIDGNNVTSTSTNLANGAKVATYGTTSVKGVSYTRINSADSNEYVLTKYVDGSIKSSQSKTTSLDVMYKSAIYNKDGKTTGKHISGYTDTDFAAKDGKAEEVTINGGKFLKLAGNKGYVRTRNVFGSKMTLKRNATVYKSNGRRASKKILKKGSTVTVYGGQYKAIRHYRKNAVRIGHNRYVKVVNVNYKLAD